MCDYSIGQLAELLNGQLALGTMPPFDGDQTPVGKIVSDTRRLERGDVFWALLGPNFNGADFADEAFARGASGVVVAGRRVEPWAGRWSLQIDDTRWGLWRLAEQIRDEFSGTVIGVTGSVGKTTTRQMIHTLLGRQFDGSASPANFNNFLGVPLSMARWKSLDDYAVIEMGTSGPGEIAPLAHLAAPNIAVITCIGEAHLGGFGCQEAIAEEKTELLAALPADGCAILGSDPWLRRFAYRSPAEIVWVGEDEACDLIAREVRSRDGVLSFRVEAQEFRLPVWGRHHLTAALAAIAVGRQMGVSLATAAEALAEFAPLPQRSHVFRTHGMTVIDDTYNASPSAMQAALELLGEISTTGRRIVVCGDLCDLGDQTTLRHRQVGEQAVTLAAADFVIACGSQARQVVLGALDAGLKTNQAIACRTPLDALPLLRREARPGDSLLFKASRVTKLEQLLAAFVATPQQAAA